MYVVPDPVESAAASMEGTRSDIKEVIDLFRLVAVRDPQPSTSSCSVSSTSAARRWSDVVDDEERESYAQAAGSYAGGERRTTCSCTQTDLDLSRATLVAGEAALVGLVEECACFRVLDELLNIRHAWHIEFADLGVVSDVVASTDIGILEISDFDVQGGAEAMLRCNRAACSLVELVGGVAGERYSVHCKLLSMIGAEIALPREELHPCCTPLGEGDEDCDQEDGCSTMLTELEAIKGRISFVLQCMCSGAQEFLQGLDCRVLLSLDPEWTCVPSLVSVRAQEIRKCFPPHLDGCPTEEMDEFDLVLNEVLARPATTSSFVEHMRELQSICPDLDAMCEMLGLRVSWLELKRLLIVRAQTRSSSFSLLELVEEVRHSAR